MACDFGKMTDPVSMLNVYFLHSLHGKLALNKSVQSSKLLDSSHLDSQIHPQETPASSLWFSVRRTRWSIVSDQTFPVAAAAPPPFSPGNPALCVSCPLVTPSYCRLGDLLCFVFIV